jgi:hypothetical protein
MKFNSYHSIPQRRNAAAFTLAEFLIGNSIGLIAMTVLASLTLFTSRSFVAIGNYNELERHSSLALDTLSKDIRGTEVLLRNAAGQTVTYTYSPGARTLVRTLGVQQKVLLEGCDFLRFNMSQRNPSNDLSFYPATTIAQAKLLDVSWRCSRRVLGQQVNTESVQTAKIVIRN